MFRVAGSGTAVIEEARARLARLGIADDALRPVGALAYGRQRLVEIAIALGLRPRVLLLDEPAAGVPSAETRIILDAVASLPADIAVLIIEHDMDLVFRFAREITVLVQGAVLTQGNFAANATALIDAWRITGADRFLAKATRVGERCSARASFA
jgi:ABC-type branched-subunit amino acid transport system ATPase component